MIVLLTHGWWQMWKQLNAEGPLPICRNKKIILYIEQSAWTGRGCFRLAFFSPISLSNFSILLFIPWLYFIVVFFLLRTQHPSSLHGCCFWTFLSPQTPSKLINYTWLAFISSTKASWHWVAYFYAIKHFYLPNRVPICKSILWEWSLTHTNSQHMHVNCPQDH